MQILPEPDGRNHEDVVDGDLLGRPSVGGADSSGTSTFDVTWYGEIKTLKISKYQQSTFFLHTRRVQT